ncbi:hypothetical protein [Clostridium saccharobutylicum]|uniref:hypothetical protein n=1 Tax=Clostridium saccharobutylicum TaxID=169679 RepID=UPI00040266F8|nr:hypothetical protein [Clostridium saccharobutylicum]MBA8895269.1 hypothetical protein [Clostridium saccharobutylicum]MBA8982161.1 hypothetical protein [Clostridium saccharobutylicum]MBC2484123.1 hypothetical protein [Clostridium saccharobutylicum]MBC2562271.1 hypothetical protein [Clostridium saccharobutylicum]NOV56494.1 hypothetical protein [Clostridium saccharobutylicum]
MINRKKWYSFVPVTREKDCGVLTAEVVFIPACSLSKLMTSKNETTFTEEIIQSFS